MACSRNGYFVGTKVISDSEIPNKDGVEPQLPRCLEVTWGVIEEEAFLGDSLRLASWPLVVGCFICF